MNKLKVHLAACSVLLTMLLVIPNGVAAENTPEILAEVWVMTPKADKAEALELALKKHAAHRTELKDPRKWNI